MLDGLTFDGRDISLKPSREREREREKEMTGVQVCCSGMVKPVIVPASHSSGYCTHR